MSMPPTLQVAWFGPWVGIQQVLMRKSPTRAEGQPPKVDQVGPEPYGSATRFDAGDGVESDPPREPMRGLIDADAPGIRVSVREPKRALSGAATRVEDDPILGPDVIRQAVKRLEIVRLNRLVEMGIQVAANNCLRTRVGRRTLDRGRVSEGPHRRLLCHNSL